MGRRPWHQACRGCHPGHSFLLRRTASLVCDEAYEFRGVMETADIELICGGAELHVRVPRSNPQPPDAWARKPCLSPQPVARFCTPHL